MLLFVIFLVVTSLYVAGTLLFHENIKKRHNYLKLVNNVLVFVVAIQSLAVLFVKLAQAYPEWTAHKGTFADALVSTGIQYWVRISPQIDVTPWAIPLIIDCVFMVLTQVSERNHWRFSRKRLLTLTYIIVRWGLFIFGAQLPRYGTRFSLRNAAKPPGNED